MQAARLLVAAGYPKEATPLFREAGALAEGAEAIFAAGLYDQAALLFEQLRLFERAAECCVQLGDTPRALFNLEKATEELRRRSDLPQGGLDHQLRELDLYRADLLERLGRAGEAARLLAARGLMHRAASLFEKAGDPGQAVQSFLDAGLVDEALDLARRTLRSIPRSAPRYSSTPASTAKAPPCSSSSASSTPRPRPTSRPANGRGPPRSTKRSALSATPPTLYYRVDRFYDAGRCFARSSGPGQNQRPNAARPTCGRPRPSCGRAPTSGRPTPT